MEEEANIVNTTETPTTGASTDTATQAVQTTTPVQEVGVISSDQGLKEVQKAQETEKQLSPYYQGVQGEGDQEKLFGIQADSPEEALKDPRLAEKSGVQNISEQDYITLTDPDGRETTLKGDALTDARIKELESQGYTQVESSISKGTTNPELDQLEKEANKATNELNSLRQKVMGLVMTDKDLQGELDAISNSFNAQQDEMRRINENRAESIRTLGVRIGSRYTGGSGGVIGSIIAEEQRQGIARIAAIEAQKQAALAGAKRAAKEFNLQLYTQEIQRAEKEQQNKLEAVQTFMKVQEESRKKLEETYVQEQVEFGIIDLINQGVNDPMAILTQLRNQGIKATPKQVTEFTNLMANQDDLAGLDQDLRTYEFLKKNRPEELSAMGISNYQQYLRATGDAKRAVPKATGGGDEDDSNEFSMAQLYSDSFEGSDEQLKAELMRDSDLSVSEINAIVSARKKVTKAPPSPAEVTTKVKGVLSSVRGTYSRAEAEQLAQQQLKKSMGLKDDAALPGSYEEAIKDAVAEVYGRTFLQKIIPGGR